MMIWLNGATAPQRSLHERESGEVAWTHDERERLLRILAGAAFLIIFQAYMVVPPIPHLAKALGVPEDRISRIVPAYMLPYGLATLLSPCT
jgi:predicted MFS family arabinose efflux permease